MRSKILSKIEKILKKESLECYVLMICNKSVSTEEMLVEMTYDGNADLGCYMLENGLSILEQKKLTSLQKEELDDNTLS